MVQRRFLSNLNPKTPLKIWLTVAASSAMVAAIGVPLLTRTVQADALLPWTGKAGAPVVTAPAALLAPQSTADLLHGMASWYGGIFNGRRTASGERYNMYAMTACHPTLPFGTVVRVKNLANNRTVDVRITDRGYLYEGRIIDLSYAAAQRLAILKPGLAPVELTVLTRGKAREPQK